MTLPAENLGNILAFDKETKRKLLSLISAGRFIKNNQTKNSFRYYEFSVAIMYFCETGQNCLYHKDGYSQKLQYIHYNSVLIS